MTVRLLTLNGRSSLGSFDSSAATTTEVIGTNTLVRASSDVGLVAVNTSPVPSSLMVTVAGVAVTPLVLVAVKLNGSLLSIIVSCSGVNSTRTNALPFVSSGIKASVVYGAHEEPFQYSILVNGVLVLLGRVNLAS